MWPLEFLLTTLYSSDTEVPIISKQASLETPMFQNILLHLETSYSSIQTYICWDGSPGLSGEISHFHLCPPEALATRALKQHMVLPPQTVSVSNIRVTSLF